ncbi:MAG: hypothetical protein Q7T34_02550 [Candidatus Parcubacteria bacterium]|nr:hypothetical protein [Candidatus Parcubacteria bacterium]
MQNINNIRERGIGLLGIEIIVAIIFIISIFLISPKIGGLVKIFAPFFSFSAQTTETKKTAPVSSPSKTAVPIKPPSGVSPTEEPKPDLIPPKRSNLLPKYDLPAGTLKTIISMETDEVAACRYSQASGTDYDAMINTFSAGNTLSHSVLITTLNQTAVNNFFIKCKDNFGNKNIDDSLIAFSVKPAPDITPPERRNLAPSGVLLPGIKEILMSVSTDEKAHCRFSTTQGKSYGTMESSFSSNKTYTYHTFIKKGLENGVFYDYFIKCCDFSNNCNDGDVMLRFSVGAD